ncbi:MAG: hypothetical protein JWQ65_1696 [Devosia sp.]|nr:hypothetical protein [Devosia sp.]
MSNPGDLADLTAGELVAGYGSGAFTPVEALVAVHARIDTVNAGINAIIAEDRAAALQTAQQSAERWAEHAPLSALDGVPLTIKDNLHAAGLPATWGSRLYGDFIPDTDEPPVERLRNAGAIIIGKTNVPEFTLQGYTDNLLFGVTQNPLAPGKTPGGSTGGGAAAVAAGIGPIALGTDGGGSLRRPAAHCGLFAVKPSIGQVARAGGFVQILADFEVVGPIARTPDDLRTAFDVLAGFDQRDPRSFATLAADVPFSQTPRIGYFNTLGAAPVDPRITRASNDFAGALAAAGCRVEDIAAPFDLERVNAAWGTVAAAGLAWHLSSQPEASALIGGNARATAERGRAISASDYMNAWGDCLAIRAEAARLFDDFDLLLCPTTAALAWPAAEPFPPLIDGRPAGPRGHAIFTAWMNVAGLCALSIPVATTPDAGGIGMQLVAAPGRDRALLDFLATLPATAMAPRLTIQG